MELSLEMQTGCHAAWEARFAGTLALCCVRLVFNFTSTLCRCRKSRFCRLHDVSVAFYDAVLDEDIWVDPPRGEEDEHAFV